MGNLKTLRGLLVCIAILVSMSINSAASLCILTGTCEQYREYKLLSQLRIPKPPLPLKRTIVTKWIKTTTAYLQRKPMAETKRITTTAAHLQRKRTVVTKRITTTAAVSGACQDDIACTRFKDIHRLCSGTDGWYRRHCRLSCNMCITNQSFVTRVISHTSTTTPITATQVSVQEHDDVSLQFSHPKRVEVTTWIPSPVASSGACEDDKECTRFKDIHRLCTGTDGWYRQNCRVSCNMCITDEVSVTREISHTSTTSPVTANQVSVQEHDDVSLEFSYPVHAERTTWTPSPAEFSYPVHAERTTLTQSPAEFSYPVHAERTTLTPSPAEFSYPVHAERTTLTPSPAVRAERTTLTLSPAEFSYPVHAERTTLTPSPAEFSYPVHAERTTLTPSPAEFPVRAERTNLTPSPAGAGQHMEGLMTNKAVIAATFITPILVIVVIVIIVITRIKGRKVVLTPQREQSKFVVTYSGLTPQPEKQAYTAIDLEAHTYSSVDDIKHEAEDYPNFNDRGSQPIGMNQEQRTSDSRTVDCTLYENAGKKMGTEDTDNYNHIYEN